MANVDRSDAARLQQLDKIEDKLKQQKKHLKDIKDGNTDVVNKEKAIQEQVIKINKTLKEQIDNQKVIFVQPDPKVPENKKQEFPKKQKVEEPIIPKLDWDKPEDVVKNVNDNIKKEEPKEIEVVVLPKEEITILQSTYQRKELPFEVKYAQNEVLYSVREDWRPLYLTGNPSSPLSGARKNSDGTERTLVRAAIPKAVRQEFFDRYIENPNKTGISKVNTTNYRFDATPIENAGLLRSQRSIYWYGEFNPNY